MHRSLSLFCALTGLAASTAAQDESHHGLFDRLVSSGTDDWTDRPSLSGDWLGLRSALDERGARLSLSGIVDVSWPIGDDVRSRRSDRILLDAALELDLERIFGWANTTVFAEGYMQAGRNASRDVGDLQVFSNIDEEDVTQLAELWIEHRGRLPGAEQRDNSLRVKLGKLDANSEFAHADAGLPFVHSSAGFSPTIFAFPSYPDPAVSVNVFARPREGVRLGFGLYNADDGGAVSGKRGLSAEFEATFSIGQLDFAWERGRLALGGWRHSGELARFDGGTENGTAGWYAIVEQRLDRADSGPNVTGFAQVGVADEDVSEFVLHAAAGVLVTGLCPSFDTWRSGLYLSHAELTDEPGSGLDGSELAVELFQEVPLTRSILMKPDLQWIHEPGGVEGTAAWVVTLRFELVL